MQIVTGSSAQLPQSLHNSVGRYRHRVFVEKLEWSAPMATQTPPPVATSNSPTLATAR